MNMDDNTKTDVFYFLDYARLLLEMEINFHHNVRGYQRVINEKLEPFINKIVSDLNVMSESELRMAAHRIESEICSIIKEISNHTPVMRALLRAKDALTDFIEKRFVPKKEWMNQFEKDIAVDAMHWYHEAKTWKANAYKCQEALQSMPKIPNNTCLKCGVTARKLGKRFTWVCPACKAEGWTYVIKTKELIKKRIW